MNDIEVEDLAMQGAVARSVMAAANVLRPQLGVARPNLNLIATEPGRLGPVELGAGGGDGEGVFLAGDVVGVKVVGA